MLKIIAIVIMETLLKILWIFPVKEHQCLFISYLGKQFSDSPLYIYKNVKEYTPEIMCIWGIRDVKKYEKFNSNNTIFIKIKSLKFIFTFVTSKVIITNDGIWSWLPVRKNQVIVNTWHGIGPGKKIRAEAKEESQYEKFFWEKFMKKTTVFCSWSNFCSKKILRESLGFKGDILEIGLPRHELFYDQEKRKRAARRFLNSISESRKNIVYILYAPTYRDDVKSGTFSSDVHLDMEECLKAFENKVKKRVVILFRAHHSMKNKPKGNYVDVTDYHDIQEIIAAVDYLITDYSSCMYDALIAQVPVFLYMPDYNKYIRRQEYYSDLTESPFEIAYTNKELARKIMKFDLVEYERNVCSFLEKYKFSISKDPVGEIIKYISMHVDWN